MGLLPESLSVPKRAVGMVASSFHRLDETSVVPKGRALRVIGSEATDAAIWPGEFKAVEIK